MWLEWRVEGVYWEDGWFGRCDVGDEEWEGVKRGNEDGDGMEEEV